MSLRLRLYRRVSQVLPQAVVACGLRWLSPLPLCGTASGVAVLSLDDEAVHGIAAQGAAYFDGARQARGGLPGRGADGYEAWRLLPSGVGCLTRRIGGGAWLAVFPVRRRIVYAWSDGGRARAQVANDRDWGGTHAVDRAGKAVGFRRGSHTLDAARGPVRGPGWAAAQRLPAGTSHSETEANTAPIAVAAATSLG